MQQKGKYAIAGILTLLSVLFLVFVKTVDVAAIGPLETSVGFSHLNGAVADHIGLNMTWYKITQFLGYFAILVAGLFAVLGLLQLIRRRNLFKVDTQILAAGVLYAAVILLYVLFEKAVVNYRPVLMPNETDPEASFPSSHTMLTIVVMGSAMILLKKYIRNAPALLAVRIVCALILLVTVIGRLLSGVHWLTDIIGGIVISAALLAWFELALDRFGKAKRQKRSK